MKSKKLNYIGENRIKKNITQTKYAELSNQSQPNISAKELLDISKLQFKDIVLAIDILDLDINELIVICKKEMNKNN